ncbi:site-specific integrase [Polaribacter sargassicola]|uniref:site-specific integrase n=1 Tax=Polaribacter sargassicola TaxID=2836891 RepID=UPI001F3DF389|nr:site-specific integrase [Polaribacter sp. DS7-9]MCG1037303.1 site-specific integrase [Polaribacter sp. DS7-9]
MKRATFNILFFIKKSKLLKNGTAPIYMRITVNGKRSEVSLKRSILPKLWDTVRNKVKGNSTDSKDLNEYLNSVRGQMFRHQQMLQEDRKTITPKTLTNAFLGKGEKQWTLLELFQEHNENMNRLIGKEYSPLTYQRYQAALNHITVFCRSQYNNENFSLSEVNHKFIAAFEFYLKTTAKCQHNSAMKHIKALKKIILIAIANDYIRKDPFVNYKIIQKKTERECLTQQEIQKLIDKDFSIERIEIVRDLFVFQCYTGLSYRDLEKLSKNHINIGIDGYKWIIMNRTKTGSECRIPLLPTAEKILKKYKKNPCHQIKETLLPVPSNQKMNAYLKEVADLCEIDKKLHTHLARHTYATTITLSNGVPMETVSKLLGHKKIATTQIYAKVLDSKIRKDMAMLMNSTAS